MTHVYDDEPTTEARRARSTAETLIDIAGPEVALHTVLVLAQAKKDGQLALSDLPRPAQDRIIGLLADALAAPDKGDAGLRHRVFVAVARSSDQALVLLTHAEADVLARHCEEGLDNPFDGDPEEDAVARSGLTKLRSAVANLLIRRPA